MKKTILVFATMISALFACSTGASSSDALPTNELTWEVNTWDFDAMYAPYRAQYLWNDCVFPDFIEERIDVDSLVAGDSITVRFTGGYYIQEDYPSHFKLANDATLLSVTAKYAEVKRVRILDGVIQDEGETSLEHMCIEGYAADEDGALVPYGDISAGYLVCSSVKENEARILLAYNPRE